MQSSDGQAAEEVEVRLQLHRGRQPISGLVQVQGAQEATFNGWLELIDILSRLGDAPGPGRDITG